jgi:vacuolar-type H+-ATPase subunit H
MSVLRTDPPTLPNPLEAVGRATWTEFHLAADTGMIGTHRGNPRSTRSADERTLFMSKKKTLLEHASTVADSLAPHVENARDKAGPALADARDRAVPVLKDARDRAVPVLADARDRAVPVLKDARDKAAPVLKDARDKAAPYVDSARDAAAPYLDTALGKAAPLVETARDRLTNDVLPALTAAVAAVDDATEDVRAEALKRGKAVVAAAKGEDVVQEPSHRLRNLLIALGLGGIAFAVTRRLGKRQPSTTWQSSYTPPPAPTQPTATAAAGTHDTGASDPAEAAADATETPHDATTPDVPVAEMRVEEE